MRGATIRIKDRGSDVAELQAKLGVTADGRFGPNGARSRRIPGGACLTTDGVVGPKTWKALGVE